MIAYVIKSSVSLLLMFGVYWFFLRQEKLFLFNRFFLLFAILFSLVTPFISIPVDFQNNEQRNTISIFYNNIHDKNAEQNISSSTLDQTARENQQLFKTTRFRVTNIEILIFFYLTILIILLIRFIKNIALISHQIAISETINYSGKKLALLDKKINPHCFFNTVFLNRQDYLNKNIDKDLLRHELEHLRQYHSFDIIFIELVQIVFWFNPIIILYNRAIRINHEYLADNGVLRDMQNIKDYADKLLCSIGLKVNAPLVSSFNSLTKKRLLMITKPRSGNLRETMRIAATLSFLLLSFVFLSFKQINKQSAPDLTGIWEYKYPNVEFPDSGELLIRYTISQNIDSIAIIRTVVLQDKIRSIDKEVYPITGEKTYEIDGRSRIISTKWFPDKISFITTKVIYAPNKRSLEAKRVDTYTLINGNKLMLSIEGLVAGLPDRSPDNITERIFKKISADFSGN